MWVTLAVAAAFCRKERFKKSFSWIPAEYVPISIYYTTKSRFCKNFVNILYLNCYNPASFSTSGTFDSQPRTAHSGIFINYSATDIVCTLIMHVMHENSSIESAMFMSSEFYVPAISEFSVCTYNQIQ